jgi:hypothetical protein
MSIKKFFIGTKQTVNPEPVFADSLVESRSNGDVPEVMKRLHGRLRGRVMQLDKDLPLKERQRLSAARTHGMRHKETESKVRAACLLLQQKGEVVTQVAIGRVIGLSRQTVSTYRHVLDEVLKPVKLVPVAADVLVEIQSI